MSTSRQPVGFNGISLTREKKAQAVSLCACSWSDRRWTWRCGAGTVLTQEAEWKGREMQLGIHLPHIGRKASSDSIRRAAIQAEELGFADVWVSEHIIIPKDADYPPSANFWDPVLTLTWAAACTRRVRLGTSVLVLPMRHPLPLAKELATLQNLSHGRLILGAGVGWLEAEFTALGVPFRERGRRMDEGIALMRAVWSQDPVTFRPRWIPAKIDEMRMQPQPCAPIPIWIGGGSDAAIKRALRLDGWHGSS